MTACAVSDRRPAALSGSLLAHLVVLLGLVAIPAGVTTRLDRRIEASLAPMPQSAPVEVQSGAGAADASMAEETIVDAPMVEADLEGRVEGASTAVEAASPQSMQKTLPDEPEEAPEAGEPTAVAAVAAVTPGTAADLPPPDVLTSEAGEVTTAASVGSETVDAVAPAPSRPTPATRPSPATPKPAPPPAANPARAMQSRKRSLTADPPRARPARREVAQATPGQRPAVRKPARAPSPGASGGPSDIGASTTARASGPTRRDYAALVLAAIRSRVRYPAEARARGREGVAMVSFAVGPAGRIRTASLARGTGDASLDGAAVALVRALSLPPPPGGSFRATVPIRYRLSF
jgi:periplasmic protein TonB